MKATVIAVALAGATLAAAPQASAFGIEPISPYALPAQDPAGALIDQDANNGLFGTGGTLAPGTGPTATPIPGGYRIASR